MYNEQLKKKFIEEYAGSLSTAGHATALFNALEKFEIEWGTDVCTMDTEDIKNALDSIALLRSKSNWMMLVILKEYIKWCSYMKVPGVRDGVLQIEYKDIIGVEKLRKQTVSSPLQMQAYLDSLFDAESLQTLDNIYRCCCWLAYGGFEEDEIARIQCSDVNFSEMTVVYEDKDMPIYREAIQAFRNAVELDRFVYIHPKYQCVKQRISGEELIRGVKAGMNSKTIRPVLSSKNKIALEQGKTDKQLSFYRMRISGLFYRIYERERAGVPVSFRDEAIRYVKSRQFSGGISFERRVNIAEKEYFDDYQRWKIAFMI